MKTIATLQQSNTPGSLYKILIESIGQALPPSVIAIAKGLNVPAQHVANVIYRAPAILVDSLSYDIAQKMESLMVQLGYEVKVCDQDAVLNLEESRRDISVYIRDTRNYAAHVNRIAEFIGSTAEEANKLISSPPGIIMGGVSLATVDRFKAFLGEGIDVKASDPATALYDVFLLECDPHSARTLLADLERTGVQLIAKTGCIARDLDQEAAKSLWARHAKTGTIRIVMQDFLRCDILLCDRPELNEEQKSLLSNDVGIPDEHLEAVVSQCPVTLFEALDYAQALPKLQALTEAGLQVRADLITFAQYSIVVKSGSNLGAISSVLRKLDLLPPEDSVRQLPYTLPYVLPELQARLLAETLAGQGIVTEFLDPQTE